MAVINQIAPLINSTARQIWGEDAPSVQDLSGLIALGNKVLSSDTDKETFLGVLSDRIKKTVIRTLDIDVEMPNLLMSEDAFFGVLQKIDVQPMAVVDDNSWNIGDSNYATTIWNINKPLVSQSLFHNISAFTIPVTIPDVMLKSAFASERDMGAFISAIFGTIEQSLIMYINALTHLAICNLIAERSKEGKTINLLEMYNDTFTPTEELTPQKALYNSDFLQYSAMIIRNYIKYMNTPSVLYNNGTKVRATARDNMHVLMLTDYVSAYTTYFESSAFHNELVEMPYFTEVSYWQNNGQLPTFANNSKVNIIPSSENGEDSPTAQVVNGVICTLADRQSVGVSLTEDWSGADRNNRERYTNYTYGANRGYFNDLSENAVVFVIDETE